MPKMIPLFKQPADDCAARGCFTPGVFFMCRRHWLALPPQLRGVIRAHYPKVNERPKREWLRAAMTAVAVVAIREATDDMLRKFQR